MNVAKARVSAAGRRAEQSDARDPSAARCAAPCGSRRRGRGWRGQPMASSSSDRRRARATAPSTFGEPASSRSGGSVHTTSSRSTRSTAPPPARNGSPSAKAGAGRPAPRRRTARTSCGRSTRGSRLSPGSGRVGRELGGVDEPPGRPASCAASMISSSGGTPAGDVRRPGDGEQPRAGAASSTAVTAVGGERAVGAALDKPAVAHRAHGSRFAWCSITVVDHDVVGARGAAGRRGG